MEGKRLQLPLRPGVQDGQRIRLKGKGGPGLQGGPPGDLIIRVRVQPHPRYTPMGSDLQVTQSVSLYRLILGGEVTIDTLDGPARIKLKPETEPGSTLRLKGKGMPKKGDWNNRGDLLLTLKPELPTGLSAKERQLFEELATLRAAS